MIIARPGERLRPCGASNLTSPAATEQRENAAPISRQIERRRSELNAAQQPLRPKIVNQDSPRARFGDKQSVVFVDRQAARFKQQRRLSPEISNSPTVVSTRFRTDHGEGVTARWLKQVLGRPEQPLDSAFRRDAVIETAMTVERKPLRRAVETL